MFLFIFQVSFYYLKKKSGHQNEVDRNTKLKIAKTNDTSKNDDDVVTGELENPFKKFKKLDYSELPESVLE